MEERATETVESVGRVVGGLGDIAIREVGATNFDNGFVHLVILVAIAAWVFDKCY